MRLNDRVIFPKASDFSETQDYLDHISNSREACDKRGYHRIVEEKQGKGEVMICYDCDLWFDKDLAESSDIEYKVKDPFDT